MRLLSGPLAATPMLLLAFLPGCMSEGTFLNAVSAPAGFARVSRALVGALDEAPDEVFRILRPPAEPAPEAAEEERERRTRAPTGRLRFGLRGGMSTSGGADVKWSDAPLYGLYLRRVPFERRRMTYELAAGYALTERPDEYRTSTLYTLHCDLLFGRVGGKGASVCFLLGGAAVIEDSLNNVSGETASGFGGGAEAGLSIGSASGAWEIRAVYTQIVATANANSLISVSLGFAF